MSFGEDKSYETMKATRVKLGEYVRPFTEDQVYHLTDVGNGPSFGYILRDRQWRGEE